MKTKASDRGQRFLELLKQYGWNEAVRILKAEARTMPKCAKNDTLSTEWTGNADEVQEMHDTPPRNGYRASLPPAPEADAGVKQENRGGFHG